MGQGSKKRIHTSNGDIIEVELIVPRNYDYSDEERNDFIQRFDTGTAFDKEIEFAIRKGWVRKICKTGEW